MSVDRRARVDGPAEPVGPDAFFRHDLPGAAAAHAGLLAPALRWYDPVPLAVTVDGGRWELRVEGDRLVVAEGAGGVGPELALTVGQLTDLVADLATPLRWSGDGALVTTAPLSLLLDWWVLLRGALDGVAPHVPAAVAGPGADPGPDPDRRFGPDDDPAAMGAFLESAGYLHVTGVFGPEEMAEVAADTTGPSPPGGGATGRGGRRPGPRARPCGSRASRACRRGRGRCWATGGWRRWAG